MTIDPTTLPTLAGLLDARAELLPDRDSFVFLADGDNAEHGMSYARLRTEALRIAGALKQFDIVNERVLLLLPGDLNFLPAFFACIYAGAIAVPLYPPGRAQRNAAIENVVADCEPAVILTTRDIMATTMPRPGQDSPLARPKWLTVADALSADVTEATACPAGADSIAFLQYTSGSTGSPRGVMVRHRNIMANQRMIRHGFANDHNTIGGGWLPLFHDMGLIGNVLQSLYIGCPLIFMAPASFLRRPMRWLRMIANYRITTSGAPNFAYDLCARKATDDDVASLDLGSWKVAYCGAEPIHYHSLRRFFERFRDAGFRWESLLPCYGLAEATLFVSGGPVTLPSRDGADDALQIASGAVAPGLSVDILDIDSGQHVADGEVGEICVAGPSVCDGYWGSNADNSAFDSNSGSHGVASLRTGDLGFLSGGRLFVTGRLKDMMVVNGRNIFPEDVEMLICHRHVDFVTSGSAVFSVTSNQSERLVVIQELQHRSSGPYDDAARLIRREILRRFDLQVYDIVLVRQWSLPRTTSGKIQRYKCKQAYHENAFKIIHRDTLLSAFTDLDNSGMRRRKPRS